MIMGIGTDIAELARVRRLLEAKAGSRFVARILTKDEQAFANGSKNRIAEIVTGRFAAKEAVSKAFGCGIGTMLSFQDIEIVPDSHGKPQCRITERSRTLLGLSPVDRIHVSISHTEAYAVAFAIWERH